MPTEIPRQNIENQQLQELLYADEVGLVVDLQNLFAGEGADQSIFFQQHILNRGDASLVRRFRRGVEEQGFVIDGETDSTVKLALLYFQFREGIAVDGIYGPETSAALRSAYIRAEREELAALNSGVVKSTRSTSFLSARESPSSSTENERRPDSPLTEIEVPPIDISINPDDINMIDFESELLSNRDERLDFLENRNRDLFQYLSEHSVPVEMQLIMRADAMSPFLDEAYAGFAVWNGETDFSAISDIELARMPDSLFSRLENDLIQKSAEVIQRYELARERREYFANQPDQEIINLRREWIPRGQVGLWYAAMQTISTEPLYRMDGLYGLSNEAYGARRLDYQARLRQARTTVNTIPIRNEDEGQRLFATFDSEASPYASATEVLGPDGELRLFSSYASTTGQPESGDVNEAGRTYIEGLTVQAALAFEALRTLVAEAPSASSDNIVYCHGAAEMGSGHTTFRDRFSHTDGCKIDLDHLKGFGLNIRRYLETEFGRDPYDFEGTPLTYPIGGRVYTFLFYNNHLDVTAYPMETDGAPHVQERIMAAAVRSSVDDSPLIA